MYQSIESRVQAVQANIDLACSGINQSAESVKVIAVSKLQSTEIIQEAYDNGVRAVSYTHLTLPTTPYV